MFIERIKNWKQIIAGFAIFGFILSFVIGLFGGVAFGIIILRAFIFAIVFGGISIFIMVLIDNFIPELIDSDSDNEDEDYSESSDSTDDNDNVTTEESRIRGGNLDITIEDEDSADPFDPVQELKETSEAEIDRESAESGSQEPAAELIEELEEIEAADSSDSAATDKNKDLPDIGDFADSFSSADISGSSDGLSSIDGKGHSSSAEIMGDMLDTKDMIKAVQTVLKKDQEG